MNSVAVLLLTTTALIAGYRFYAKKIESLWQIDPNRTTPANVKYDGVDYIPAKNWFVLFGHHFSSIAGAGPIIGPALAITLWGWGPSLLWIVFGSIFFGGIHDFGSLMISIREEGASIGDVATKSISDKAKIILSVFIWLALMLVIAVFTYYGASTFVTKPEVVMPSFGIIPLAILVGLALYKLKWNATIVTIVALLALGGLIFAGKQFPMPIANGQTIWMIVLLIYCFFASTLPVNFLLQPRDYLSSFLLFGGLLLAVLGIFISHPTMHAPMFIANADNNPSKFLWPMMFITIACGANSGFHSLISSGTTSKQLPNERYAKRIGFGGMLVEGFLATIVVILIVAGLSLTEFNQHIINQTKPVDLYGLGFGNMTKPFLGDWGPFIALTILNVFILTTLDSATRITRYVTEELFRIKNRYLSTSLVIGLSALLAFGKDSANKSIGDKIWPAFGASNQLVAALALLVITCWLLSKKRPVWYSLIPALLMLGTSLTALVFQVLNYWKNKEILLIVISVVLISAALYLVVEVIKTFIRMRVKNNIF